MPEPDPPAYEPYRPTFPEPEAPDPPPEPMEASFAGPTPASTWLPDNTPAPSYGDHSTRRGVGSDADPERVARLGPAPRPVPLTYRVAVLNLGVIELFVLFMVAVSPIALWILVPTARVVAPVVVAAALVTRAVLRYRSRIPVLRWGEVATVTGCERRPTATSNTNVPMRTATGWSSRTQMYTGSGYRNEIDFRIGAQTGRLVLRGMPYAGGVVLADPRDPRRALCVSQVPFDLTPDEQGDFRGTLSAWSWLSLVVSTAVLVGAVGLAVLAVLTVG